MEHLVSFGLPPTFPPELVPEKAAQFVANTTKGMSQTALLELATESGFNPLWKPLPHLGPGIYGLGLDVDGLQVPFMVKMDLPHEMPTEGEDGE